MSNATTENPIDALKQLEQKIISLLETASQACDQLTALDEANSENIKKLIADYVGGVRDVQKGLRDQLNHLIDNSPYRTSVTTYGSKKNLEIQTMKIDLLQQQLAQMKKSLHLNNNNQNRDEMDVI
jgi:ABC-type transporter Mla subunit MlaD